MKDLIDLSQYPSPPFFNTLSLDEIKAQRYQYIQQEEGIELDESDSNPASWVTNAGAYRELILREDFDRQSEELFITKASGAALDLIGITYYKVWRLESEDDDRYRERLLLSPEGFSTAGPEEAYVFHALSADVRVASASAFSPEPGVVHVAILSTEGDGIPTQELLDIVSDYLSDKERRPLTDSVFAVAAQIVDYAVLLDLEVQKGASLDIVREAALKRVTDYVEETELFNQIVARSQLVKAAHTSGVVRVTSVLPDIDIVPSDGKIPRCELIAIEVKYYQEGQPPPDSEYERREVNSTQYTLDRSDERTNLVLVDVGSAASIDMSGHQSWLRHGFSVRLSNESQFGWQLVSTVGNIQAYSLLPNQYVYLVYNGEQKQWERLT
ncbi:baseplate J/gp47 family protein [Vibrio sp. YMD68]|uniref:baseplate assembly protein n=1 Tax=Vibrio sp. YMD68 TaxID=3042300 RepID=UPI002499D639|nr:baseplate J/gp47 family protein [Vibrio sp. YMD68]WGV98824.1 baseplate J/gp47 family protein [Vibrio sp. YMD68]WGW01249.1 baseplate J/gp47 family protein [Vibrio sp. YMD68]